MTGGPGRSGPRLRWHLAANSGVIAWLVGLLGVSLAHPFVPESRWLLVHLLLLGAVTNAVLVWSAHFADALLKNPSPSRRGQVVRLVALNAGVLAVVAGIVTGTWTLTLAGAVGVGVAAAAHGVAIAQQGHRALPSRFGASVRYYVAASACLPVGAALGTLLARHPGELLHGRLVLAHVAVNVLGWLGLTVLGTLLTLWPTILRTRIAEGAERQSRQALPVLVVSLVLVVVAALTGARVVTGVALLGYLAAALWSLRPMLGAARAKPPQTYAAWSVLAAVAWLAVSLAWLTGLVLLAPDWSAAGEATHRVAVPLAAGFAGQVLLGALTYLLPVVRGGGPSVVRATTDVLERGAALRVVVANAGLVLLLLPAPSVVRVLVSALVLAAYASFLVLLPLALRTARRSEGTVAPTRARHQPEPLAEVRTRHTGWAMAGLSAVVLAVALGTAVDPSALRTASAASAGVAVTGHTTTVRVEARDMRFHPDSVDVPAGNRLVIEVVNRDSDVHDLALETGQSTGRLSTGQTGRVQVDVVGRDLDGWCTIVGHRQMGMVFSVNVVGAAAASSSGPGNSHDGTMQGGTTQDGTIPHDAVANGEAVRPDFLAKPPAWFTARDARLAPAPSARVHRVLLVAQEVEREVAVGVRQRLWTFNGTAPGPVLHGRVGDRFEVRLRNDAGMGHSIDFHAGALAPDAPMRTIAPGESLTFSFTAQRAGIWMYHCSSMPMSLHIANGMFGAVVIDPPGLPGVDREYLLVQSELYLGAQGGTADPAKVAAERPDAVVFNGFANQYDHHQLAARVGERVRVWVLDAGPNRPSSFHVVGSQFDTVFLEGSYLARRGSPGTVGGAQALALQPAQGGFVELSFPEAGHYPFVSHIMVDAERGAHGVFRITR
ncbi:multicopper oxidase domain-containing protein [Phycicoccus sp. SLBN-51]|uniref:multicopper oxidase domain-containing protein n=1 Tax=Phycicoccus sp. SLBN-51 TaxID=2768447 RepID=UPI00114D6AD0|nr:multicopper oxidase domain-containing protein [Phycicoccus sp. SLBN-51]TQJ50259.1 nitrite reductase (NO-forming) [Phycicoccus sp. SLBN-51]